MNFCLGYALTRRSYKSGSAIWESPTGQGVSVSLSIRREEG